MKNPDFGFLLQAGNSQAAAGAGGKLQYRGATEDFFSNPALLKPCLKMSTTRVHRNVYDRTLFLISLYTIRQVHTRFTTICNHPTYITIHECRECGFQPCTGVWKCLCIAIHRPYTNRHVLLPCRTTFSTRVYRNVWSGLVMPTHLRTCLLHPQSGTIIRNHLCVGMHIFVGSD